MFRLGCVFGPLFWRRVLEFLGRGWGRFFWGFCSGGGVQRGAGWMVCFRGRRGDCGVFSPMWVLCVVDGGWREIAWDVVVSGCLWVVFVDWGWGGWGLFLPEGVLSMFFWWLGGGVDSRRFLSGGGGGS